MASGQQARGGQTPETMASFVERRRREQANAGAKARGAAHQAYGVAIRSGHDLKLTRPADVTAHGALLLAAHQATPARQPKPTPHPLAQAKPQPARAPSRPSASIRQVSPHPAGPHAAPKTPASVGHPGFVESLIPVWGSGREAVADYQEGDYAGATLNGVLAASDLFLAGDIGKAVAKGGLYAIKGPIGEKAADRVWEKVRERMGEEGMLKKFQHGHHFFIPKNGWGKKIWNTVKNHPLNIKPMPDVETHMRIHFKWKGKPRFNAIQRYWYGTPTWSKVATAAVIGHPVAAVQAQEHRK
jgi:hypothetical protein